MSRPPQDGKIECPRCGFANYPRAPYCIECSEPLDEPEDVDDKPSGKGKRRRKRKRPPREQPRSLVIVVGAWLLFGPIAIMCVVTLLESLPQTLRRGFAGREELGPFLLFAALMGLGLYLPYTIISRVTVGYLQEQRRLRKKRKSREHEAE